MFTTNKIICEQIDLQKLFFGDTFFPPDANPGLDFFSFMSFAISKKGDQDFRDFMRKVKETINEHKKAHQEKANFAIDHFMKNSTIGVRTPRVSNDISIDKKEPELDEVLYLPMNFNKVLDYFNDKSKERIRFGDVEEAIVMITKF